MSPAAQGRFVAAIRAEAARPAGCLPFRGMEQGRVRIGVSGWRYAPWRGEFYPKPLRQAEELSYLASQLSTVEINGTFYSLQSPASFAAWHAATPEGFVFAVKGSRYLTHILRLKEFERPLANFFASGLFNLGEKLGPLLWQFPPNLRFEPDRFETFMAALPHDTTAALALARRRDARMTGRARLAIDAPRRLRHAFEIRNESFLDAHFIALLRRYGIALVVADTGGKWPSPTDVTADFLYLRLHGATELYRSRYSEASLRKWARRIHAWRSGTRPDDDTPVSMPSRRAGRAMFIVTSTTPTSCMRRPTRGACSSWSMSSATRSPQRAPAARRPGFPPARPSRRCNR